MKTLTSGQLAKELGVSHSAIVKWAKEGLITPEFTTPGGHHRWDPDKVRDQIRAQRQRGDE
jgi:DNA-binding transcriptional MerR regulator